MRGQIYIVRHGNTFDPGDTVLRAGARTDLPLSQSGQAQAAALSRAFKAQTFDRVFASPLKRTQETARAIFQAARIETADFLTEIDYGPDEGRPESEVVARLGQAVLDRWNTAAVPPADWQVDPNQIRQEWVEFFARCDRTANTLVVTSNGVARFILDVVAGVGQDVPRKLRTGSYGVIALNPTGPRLNAWNVRP
jgi:probable phosphoglycerate mutase